MAGGHTTPETGILHHVGYWVEDLPKEVERLEAAGFGSFMSGPSLAVHRGPGGLLLEPCDLGRDRPFLRDLFPAGSPLHGVPDNSKAVQRAGQVGSDSDAAPVCGPRVCCRAVS